LANGPNHFLVAKENEVALDQAILTPNFIRGSLSLVGVHSKDRHRSFPLIQHRGVNAKKGYFLEGLIRHGQVKPIVPKAIRALAEDSKIHAIIVQLPKQDGTMGRGIRLQIGFAWPKRMKS